MPKKTAKKTAKKKPDVAVLIELAKEANPSREKPRRSYSGSVMKAYAYCPAWEPQDETDKDTTAADEGTLMHTCVENNTLIEGDGPEVEEKNHFIQMCIDYKAELSDGADEVVSEIRIEPVKEDGIVIRPSGFADLVVKHGKHATIVDWKFGMIPVDDATHNLQGWAYLSGVARMWADCDTFTVVFPQPRIDEISEATFTRDELRLIEGHLEQVLRDAQAPEGERRECVVFENCQYCGRIGECGKLRSMITPLAKYYAPDDDIPLVHPSEVTSAEVLSKCMKARTVVDKWSASVKEHALQFRLGGHEIPGYALTSRKGKSSFGAGDTPMVYTMLKDTVDLGTFLGCCEPSLTKLQEAVGAVAERGKKTAAKAELEEKLTEEGLLVRGPDSYFMRKSRD